MAVATSRRSYSSCACTELESLASGCITRLCLLANIVQVCICVVCFCVLRLLHCSTVHGGYMLYGLCLHGLSVLYTCRIVNLSLCNVDP